MKYTVLLDACVLVPISLADLLLRLAEDPALYSPRWSKDILEEIRRNLKREPFNVSPQKADYRIACMESAFPEALVVGYEPFIEKMTNNDDDRHVLAAAVRAKADAVLTANSKHFPKECLEPFGIEKLTPDRFLINQLDLSSEIVYTKLTEQARDKEMTLESLLNILEKMVPRFVAHVRSDMTGSPSLPRSSKRG